MELAFEKVESAGVDVSGIVNQLVSAEPGTYRVGSGSVNELARVRDALKAHNYVGKIKNTGEKTGERPIQRGARQGEMVEEFKHDLLIVVTAPSGEYEPQPRVEETVAPSAEPAPVADETVEATETVEDDAPKGKRR